MVLLFPVVVFFVLLLAGLWLQELEFKHVLLILGFWVLGMIVFQLLALPRRSYAGVEALIDCILILKIFGGDIRIR